MFDALGLICMCVTLFHPSHADLQCMEPETQESPIKSLTWNWRRMELSWESSEDFSTYICMMTMGSEFRRMTVKNRKCSFSIECNLPLHRGINFTIEVPDKNISKHCQFIPEGNAYDLGMKGSAIENFSCVIYDVSLMNCTWQAGRNAPADTQYFLYWKKSSDENEIECELYIKGENGMHTGCRFQNVMIEGEPAYFLVNGSSKDSQILFYDDYIRLYTIERFTPPLNVSVNCTSNPAGCIITWQKPLTSYQKIESCFEYEINIQNKDEPEKHEKDPPISVSGYKYEFKNYNVKKQYILKIRARGSSTCTVNRSWGEWSEPIEFGQEKDYFIFVLLLLIVLGTILVTLLLFFLRKRYCSFKRIFPPIPQPRDKFNTSHDENIQTENLFPSSLSCTKEVTMVQEMT
ncbi:granulocyte-macrophage colony-stimulating factor receptor subunit alpha-like isoform X2 [Oxyura jamaicensis]|uniref:granulocyte-macrophage colony-stimulating factor receptor subunit alpha-like isoform X2 n=1 Tax=Oxyura jamaicensis TaxID=8884 RepID=UPI0015A5C667|nr:granulocyte-macrophage colony-stimulating factor receptor subunit alpha-like isoform X2 [Oxyura jamaicensis]